MKRERRKLTTRELRSITTPDLVRRVVRPDEEKLGEIHDEDITRQHEDEDLIWKGSKS